jgi:hypothetical protein
MTVTRGSGLADFASGLGDTLKIDSNTGRVGINSTDPTAELDVQGGAVVSGVVTASSFVGDGSNLTGVSGFATALSSDQNSILNQIFKTPETLNVGAGISVSVESDSTSGNVAFTRVGIIHVSTGSTFHVGSGTTLQTNVLGVF